MWYFMQLQCNNAAVLPNLMELHIDGSGQLWLTDSAIDAILGMPPIKRLRLHQAQLGSLAASVCCGVDWGSQASHLNLEGSFMTKRLLNMISEFMTKLEYFRFSWSNRSVETPYRSENLLLFGPASMVSALER